MSKQADLVHGVLNKESWDDFVSRLKEDCIGDRVKDHHTADALFIVQARRRVFGIDPAYTDKTALIDPEGDSQYISSIDYWESLDKEEQEKHDAESEEQHLCAFTECDTNDAFEIAINFHPEMYVTGWDEHWEYVNSHFTHAAAERFIERKKHDYRLGLRVYVEAQTHCWEFNAIKEAIMSGKIALIKE